eukprot:scaffold4319_cov133-Skeletonema_dohrnii-CCMP3373.AAC.5
MEQVHAKNAVRHAEKRRIGTCQFANRIATVSLDAYKSVVPKSHRDAMKQTCVAAIVAHYSNKCNQSEEKKNDDLGQLRVLGLGVGTKFVSHDVIITEEQQNEINNGCYGKRIRDCHAEVLARRAFRRQVALEILTDLRKESSSDSNAEFNDDDPSILERVECKDDGMQTKICYRLKSNVTIHFYASSAPCGNATLKKFVKMEKEVFDASLGPDEWPQSAHKPIGAHSLRLGQFALLVKKDNNVTTQQQQQQQQLPEKKCDQAEIEQQPRRKKTKIWPCREDDAWCPPSCSITNYNKGTIHSCSDKICRWNCIGLQGSFLMPLLDSPMYMTTLTVGRKFSRAVCQRAVCCRAEGFGNSSNDKYKLNHPALMETNVYMDESGTHQMEGLKMIGEDASFDSNLCWVWWPGKGSNDADCIDGKTGLIATSCNGETVQNASYSDVSTYALLKINLEILRMCGAPEAASLTDEKLSLSELRMLKRRLSAQYESAKDTFLLRHRVFRDWCCREARVKI